MKFTQNHKYLLSKCIKNGSCYIASEFLRGDLHLHYIVPSFIVTYTSTYAMKVLPGLYTSTGIIYGSHSSHTLLLIQNTCKMSSPPITYDLIPHIEEKFRGLGEGWARFVYGGSTGGWEALAVQVFYPDEYAGQNNC